MVSPVRTVVAAACALGTAAASAQPLDQLACAAGVHCSGALQPDEVRVVLGLDSQHEAEQAFIDASRDFPDPVWRCAAAGECAGSMTQNEARVLIPLPDEAFAGAEVTRRRQAAAPPGAATPPAVAAPSVPGKARGPSTSQGAGTTQSPPRAGIDIEVNRPGPTEIDLQTPPHNPKGEIQPLDGSWIFAHGSTPHASGQCLPGVAEGVGRQMPAPQSGPVTFARPFNASQILRSPQVAWQRMAPNHWRGRLTGAGGNAIRMEWDVRVTSPTRMEGASIVRVNVPSACTLSTPFTFVRQ